MYIKTHNCEYKISYTLYVDDFIARNIIEFYVNLYMNFNISIFFIKYETSVNLDDIQFY